MRTGERTISGSGGGSCMQWEPSGSCSEGFCSGGVRTQCAQ